METQGKEINTYFQQKPPCLFLGPSQQPSHLHPALQHLQIPFFLGLRFNRFLLISGLICSGKGGKEVKSRMHGEENILIYTKCMYKCVHEHELVEKKYKEEGHNTRIMSGGLATWPSYHLHFQLFFFYFSYQLPKSHLLLGQ